MARILAIDYGLKRTGIAVTDPLQITATPLTTVDTAALMPFLKQYLQQEAVELVVLGEPHRFSGQDTDSTQSILQFKKQFEALFSIPIVLHDERFTSLLAHKAIAQSDLKRHKKQDKGLVDRVAATIILQSYMESRH